MPTSDRRWWEQGPSHQAKADHIWLFKVLSDGSTRRPFDPHLRDTTSASAFAGESIAELTSFLYAVRGNYLQGIKGVVLQLQVVYNGARIESTSAG